MDKKKAIFRLCGECRKRRKTTYLGPNFVCKHCWKRFKSGEPRGIYRIKESLLVE